MCTEEQWYAAQAAYLDRELPVRLVFSLCADGGLLCEGCVKSEHERIADVDPGCPDDDQWRILGVQYAENGDRCDHCGRVVS